MKAMHRQLVAALALTFGIAACVSAPVTTAPAPPPSVRPAAAPAPTRPSAVQAPPSGGWLDAPATPGSWGYEDRGNLTLAIFNGPEAAFAIQCSRPRRSIELIVANQPVREGAIMQVQSETATRGLPTILGPGEVRAAIATLPATDPLLDAVALSKGRFAIGLEGGRILYLPAWAEVSRVIEDCRG